MIRVHLQVFRKRLIRPFDSLRNVEAQAEFLTRVRSLWGATARTQQHQQQPTVGVRVGEGRGIRPAGAAVPQLRLDLRRCEHLRIQ